MLQKLLIVAWLCCTLSQTVLGDGPRYVDDYPAAASKKGLQVEMVDDALALGVKHATFNVNLCSLLDPTAAADSLAWEHAGQSYAFHRAAVESLDGRIKTLSDRGVLVYAILLTYQSGNPAIDRLLIHPDCIESAPNRLGAFNTADPSGQKCLQATIEFLAERWSRPDQSCGRVVGYIAGNEVNSHWWWANMGRVSMEKFTAEYAKAVRLIHAAVRSQSSWGRVYVSLEHHWTMRYPVGDAEQAFPARDFLLRFSEEVKKDGDFDWHVAFHPYPEDLFDPRFWLDESAPHSQDAPRITFNNMEQLVTFLDRPEMLHAGKRRRIIFSEQGFHTPKGADGQDVQAAAFCYAYKKIEQLDGVDAFILHRHVDNDHEGGLFLGLRSNRPDGIEQRPPKKIYACFRDADSPQWQSTFAFALPIIGYPDWDTAVQAAR